MIAAMILMKSAVVLMVCVILFRVGYFVWQILTLEYEAVDLSAPTVVNQMLVAAFVCAGLSICLAFVKGV